MIASKIRSLKDLPNFSSSLIYFTLSLFLFHASTPNIEPTTKFQNSDEYFKLFSELFSKIWIGRKYFITEYNSFSQPTYFEISFKYPLE
jgi:hypothetical protein